MGIPTLALPKTLHPHRGMRTIRSVRRAGITRGRRRAAYLMIAPATIHIVWWIVVPVIATFVLSVTDYDVLAGTIHWVGLANFVEIFRDPVWRLSIWNTLVYTFFTVPVAMALAVVVAVLLNQKLRGRAWYRTAFFLPQVTATVAVAMVWAWMFEPRIGLFNDALSAVGINGPAWLSSTTWAMPSVIMVGIWKGIGVKMLIYLAALQSIPEDLYGAASLDGAGPIKRFWHITAPLLRPATFFVLVISMLDAFQVFDQVYVLTDGGPANSTTVITYEIYTSAFREFHLSIAAAESVVLFGFLLALTVAGRRLTGKDGDA